MQGRWGGCGEEKGGCGEGDGGCREDGVVAGKKRVVTGKARVVVGKRGWLRWRGGGRVYVAGEVWQKECSQIKLMQTSTG